MTDAVNWPAVDVSRWAGTKRSLHLYAQMLGKMRVALSPTQPNWMFTPLYLDAFGLTTGPMPCAGIAVEAQLDVFRSEIVVRRSTGEQRRIALNPPRTVAAIYESLRVALDTLDVACLISAIPQEVPDTTPLHEDTRHAEYEPEAVQRWFRAATTTAIVFDAWRSRFFGRSGIQLWWGAFDLAVILFNGKHAAPPTNRGYLMRYDLDAELMNAGLYFGDERTPAFFFGYIYPQPAGADALPIAPSPATWSSAYNEWVLPYEAVRQSPDPAAMVNRFLDAVYELCVTRAGWNGGELSYTLPPRRRGA